MEDHARPCPRCGTPTARLVRVDHYVSLFFIPLFPVKRGEPHLECERCGGVFDPEGRSYSEPFTSGGFQGCPRCGRPLERDFQFCPYCGQRL
ncbi:MAG TPA: zinc ribbon domain-containing protein [Thermodesulfobacteriota bacterium]|nr:zinc ribbon domain-containing protein [Thermodesulfobacteriota bacterium]